MLSSKDFCFVSLGIILILSSLLITLYFRHGQGIIIPTHFIGTTTLRINDIYHNDTQLKGLGNGSIHLCVNYWILNETKQYK